MTTPPQALRVECARCRCEFETYYRPSWNRDLDPISDEELVELNRRVCPTCGAIVMLDTRDRGRHVQVRDELGRVGLDLCAALLGQLSPARADPLA